MMQSTFSGYVLASDTGGGRTRFCGGRDGFFLKMRKYMVLDTMISVHPVNRCSVRFPPPSDPEMSHIARLENLRA